MSNWKTKNFERWKRGLKQQPINMNKTNVIIEIKDGMVHRVYSTATIEVTTVDLDTNDQAIIPVAEKVTPITLLEHSNKLESYNHE